MADPVGGEAPDQLAPAQSALDGLLGPIDPAVPKWATLVLIDGPDDSPCFTWHHYQDSATSIDFWPASVVKLYTCIASFERLNALEMPTDSVLVFGDWTDAGSTPRCARMLPEMCSNIFRDSTNEDYTLQLRFVGLDYLNTVFFNKAHGFERTALMRGYVHEPPYRYVIDQPQRTTVIDPTGERGSVVVEHTWSGEPYAQRLGAHVLDAATGNCSSTRDMAECLRRLMFHEVLPSDQRFDLRDDQLHLLREGKNGLTGLRNTAHAWAWDDAIAAVYPDAHFYHKPGNISDYYLDLCYVHDPPTGHRFIAATATRCKTKDTLAAMNLAIAQWMRDGKSAASQ